MELALNPPGTVVKPIVWENAFDAKSEDAASAVRIMLLD
jgi:hypothetical protein